MEYKVGNKTQIYCVTQEWVDGNESEVFVMACFLDKKDAIAFMEDTWPRLDTKYLNEPFKSGVEHWRLTKK